MAEDTAAAKVSKTGREKTSGRRVAKKLPPNP
jgi:hypothetical protein